MDVSAFGKCLGKIPKLDNDVWKRLSLTCEGAYDIRFFYDVYYDQSKKWYKGRIMDCRLSPCNSNSMKNTE